MVGEELAPPLGHRAELGAADREAERDGVPGLGLHLASERHDRPLREPEGFEARLFRLRVGGSEGEEVDADVPVDAGLELASDGGRGKGGEDLEVARTQHDAPVRGPDRGDRRAGPRGRVLLAPGGEDEAERLEGLACRVEVGNPVGDVVEELVALGGDLVPHHVVELAGSGGCGACPSRRRMSNRQRPPPDSGRRGASRIGPAPTPIGRVHLP